MSVCSVCGARQGDEVSFCPHDGTPLLAEVLDNRYRLKGRLGEGGMGTVYLAEHIALGKKVAIKVLRPEFSKDARVARRFEQEAVAASQIGHENIVDVTDFGQTPQGSLYFVMEYVEGLSLSALLQREGVLAIPRLVSLLRQVCLALEAAHARGIVHRDLKPHNVMVLERPGLPDVVKVLDFGISKTRLGGGDDRITEQGLVLGTPEYMPPEQAEGREVDARADVYALGVMVYELATGVLPFHGENAVATLLAQLQQTPTPPCARRPDLALPAELDAMTMRALAKAPDDRPGTMAEMRTLLEQLPGGRTILLTEVKNGPPAKTPPGSAAGKELSPPPVALGKGAGPSPLELRARGAAGGGTSPVSASPASLMQEASGVVGSGENASASASKTLTLRGPADDGPAPSLSAVLGHRSGAASRAFEAVGQMPWNAGTPTRADHTAPGEGLRGAAGGMPDPRDVTLVPRGRDGEGPVAEDPPWVEHPQPPWDLAEDEALAPTLMRQLRPSPWRRLAWPMAVLLAMGAAAFLLWGRPPAALTSTAGKAPVDAPGAGLEQQPRDAAKSAAERTDRKRPEARKSSGRAAGDEHGPAGGESRSSPPTPTEPVPSTGASAASAAAGSPTPAEAESPIPAGAESPIPAEAKAASTAGALAPASAESPSSLAVESPALDGAESPASAAEDAPSPATAESPSPEQGATAVRAGVRNARLSVRSRPAGATVHAKGRLLGTTPLEIARPSSSALPLQFTLQGHAPLQVRRLPRTGALVVELAPLSADGQSGAQRPTSETAAPASEGKVGDLKPDPF